jgi:fumarate hydratase class II/aspartate ammonia-lyase
MLAMVCQQVIGLDEAVAWAVAAGQLELNVMMPLVAADVLHQIAILARGVAAFDERLARGLEADADRARHYADRTVSLATALAPRIGYAAAAEVVKESVRTGRSIVELAVARGIPAREARRILDPRRLTRPGRG